MLREYVAEGREPLHAHTRERLVELQGFFEMTTRWYDEVRRVPRSTLTRFVRMGDKVARLLGSAS